MGAPPATVRWFPTTKLGSQAVRSDAAAFTAAYQRNQQALYRYCVSILHDEHDAQDALQSAAMKAFAALQAEEREFELRPWLFRIVHNEAITMLRRRRGTTTLDGTEPGRGEIEDRVAEREELRLLRADLADLPERQRAALVLRGLNGLSHGEIGLVLDLSPPAVKQALFDARTALFDARAGRALACEDVRRTVSDGDGRVLRGRMVRAHLRSCAGCRGFRAQLTARPHALRLLAPPLPAAGAASLLSQVLGASAAKVLVCVAIAGGGSTVAALEFQHRPAPARAVAHVAPVKRVSARVGRPSPRPASTPAGSGRSASARSVTVQSGSRSSPVALPERHDAGR